MASFDVLTRPWIPSSQRETGAVGERGILDTLEMAHDLAEIVDPSPLIRFGLYRLLIAFVIDAYELRDLDDLVHLLETARFDRSRLEAYADICGRNCFDLFDANCPFMQAEKNDDLDRKIHPVRRLFRHLPCGTNVAHFHHNSRKEDAIAPAPCARAIASVPPFMTAGGTGLSPSINGSPPRYALISGASLFEYICFNACVLPIASATGNAPVAWRNCDPVSPSEKNRYSLLQALTWQPRRMRLIPSVGGVCSYTGGASDTLVRKLVFCAGHRALGGWYDPQVAYSIGAKGTISIRMRERREAWRDLAPLALLRARDYETEKAHVRFERPLVVEQYRRLIEEGVLSKQAPLTLEVYECRTDMKTKIFEWNFDRLTMPVSLLLSQESGARIQASIEQAEYVAYGIGRAIKEAYPHGGVGNGKAFDRIIADCQHSYWEALRPQFDVFLTSLADCDTDCTEALRGMLSQWESDVKRVALTAIGEALDPLDTNAAALERYVKARSKFYGLLALALPITGRANGDAGTRSTAGGKR